MRQTGGLKNCLSAGSLVCLQCDKSEVCQLQKSLREESKKKQVAEIPSKIMVAVIPPVSLVTKAWESHV